MWPILTSGWPLLIIWHFVLPTGIIVTASDPDTEFLQYKHMGCFLDRTSSRDLTYSVSEPVGSIAACVQSCQQLFFFYAGVQNGDRCFCGSSFGRFGPGSCNVPCPDAPGDVCGGGYSNTVYHTGLDTPGAPSDLQLDSAGENRLSISWIPKEAPDDFVSEFKVYASLNQTFDPVKSTVSDTKIVQLSASSRSTTLLGLMPGSKYNISVAAVSSAGKTGPIRTAMFWTEGGEPDAPPAPQVLSRSAAGRMLVRLSPLTRNRNGPISGYQVVVMDQTQPTPLLKENLMNWTAAKEAGLLYWIAAELRPEELQSGGLNFTVGDDKLYGSFVNHGPLPDGRDFHVTLGVISTLNEITKTAFATVGHDQHEDSDDVVVFQFAGNNKAFLPSDDRQTRYTIDDSGSVATTSSSSSLAVGLAVAVSIFSLMLIGIIGFYIYLRRCGPRRRRARPDVQELTRQGSSCSDQETVPVQTERLDMECIRQQVWCIGRDLLEVSHEVLGRGRFGSVVVGSVKKRGHPHPCLIQVIPGHILQEQEMLLMAQDIQCCLRYGSHPHLVELLGLCEDKDTFWIVFEETGSTLKQALLDSRVLNHFPAFAQKSGKFSSFPEANIFQIMIGIANGMQHLALLGIYHRKLCARNVFMNNNIPKIGGKGIVDYYHPGQELDLTRWTAQEAFHSKSYSSKCDVWSFGILMWEIITLGGTPYAEIKSRDVAGRVMRGCRVAQMGYVSDDLFQLMLQCWQIDLDERPNFEQLAAALIHLSCLNPTEHLNFSTFEPFEYATFAIDLEMQM